MCNNVRLNEVCSYHCTFQAFSGRDASLAFISYHRRNFPHSRAKAALEGVDPSVDYTQEDHADYMELCDRVGKVHSYQRIM